MEPVSVLIPNWNGRARLEVLLPRLREQTVTPAEIIVADDGSTDGSAEAARCLGADVVRLERQRGFAAAVNAGLQRCRREWVALLNNDVDLEPDWLERVLAAARKVGEKMWAMPLDEEYKEPLKSVVADLPNIGNRWAGAVTAAMFLKEFADPRPWVHLDIAGTAWLEESKPYLAKGPTGVPMRTLVRLALDWS
ncbi:MAG: glycosyltransferase [Bryobacteraceae bacterium]